VVEFSRVAPIGGRTDRCGGAEPEPYLTSTNPTKSSPALRRRPSMKYKCIRPLEPANAILDVKTGRLKTDRKARMSAITNASSR
jgi:hypothetical protein